MTDAEVATKKEVLALRVIVSALINTMHQRETMLQNHLIERGYERIDVPSPGVKQQLFEEVKSFKDLPEYNYDSEVSKIVDHILNDI